MSMTDRFEHRRPVRSFVRREGRMTDAQKDALERLWPRYGVDVDRGELNISALFGRAAQLVVEVGFGNGDHLLAMAQARPECNFLGIEVHRPGVGRLLHEAERVGLRNLRVACADAVEIFRHALPPESVDEVVIFFPDPWPKKRHHKRRIVQAEFATLVARALRPGGRLRLATDWADYAQHMLTVLDAESQLENVAGPGAFVPRPDDRPLTRFETRGLRLGHAVFDLDYRRR
jgi:tRNA (guanine-N7-)-methyltransferase